MLIRSQDKKRIVIVANVKFIEISGYVKNDEDYYKNTGCKNNCFIIFCDGANVGEYSTEEKAVKVQDMIQEANSFANSGYYTFQMPLDKDAEVEE